jgi:hypothetical protein
LHTETILRTLLLIIVILLASMALLYLRKRSLPVTGYLFWVLVSLIFPILGPILLIALRPGEERQTH